jgi:hypothetical protein
MDANSNGITEGQSNGWRLIYCKGPEGEQLEFVQALGPVKRVFDDAFEHACWPACAALGREVPARPGAQPPGQPLAQRASR